MSIYIEVKRLCGHTDYFQFDDNAPQEELDTKVAIEEKQVCYKCLETQAKQKLFGQAVTGLLRDNYGIILPQLHGSEKQVNWANQIRNGILWHYLNCIPTRQKEYCVSRSDLISFNFTKHNQAVYYIRLLIDYLGGEKEYKKYMSEASQAHADIANDWLHEHFYAP